MKRPRVLAPLAVLFGCTGTVGPVTAPAASTPPPVTAPAAATPTPGGAAPAASGFAGGAWARSAQGCGDFQVTVAHASGLRFINIRSQRAPLGLNRVGDSVYVSLGWDGRLDLTVDEYPAPGGQEHYCNDVVSSAPARSAELKVVAGNVTVRLTGLVDARDFTLEISLHGVTVRTPTGEVEAIADATFGGIRAGWLPG